MAVLKLLRNNTLFATRAAAITNINSKAETLGDGEMWVATYGTSSNAKSILAIKRTWGVSIFDLYDTSTGDINAQIQAAITELGLAAVATSGAASDVSITDTGNLFTATNVEDALAELKTNIPTVKSYTVVDDTQNVQDLPSNVLKRYRLQETIGTASPTLVGEPIDILKDSSLTNVYLGHVDDTLSGEDASTHESSSSTVVSGTGSEALCFVHQLSNGNYKLTKVDVESFLQESEFGDGLAVDDSTHVVSIEIDSTSEKDTQATPADFLTVGSDGLKIQGIGAEMTRKISALDAVVTGKSDANETSDATATAATTYTNSTENVTIKITEVDGVITEIKVKTNDIAQASVVEENERITSAALNDLESRKADKSDLDSLTADVLENVTAGNGITVGTKTNNTQSVALKLDTTSNYYGYELISDTAQKITTAEYNALDSTTKALYQPVSSGDNVLTLSSDGLYLSSTIDCGTY